MKPLLTPAILAVVALVLAATLAYTCAEPPATTPLVGVNSDRHGPVISKPIPVDIDELPTQCSLPPGVYQTYPWTIILVVPGAETHLRCFAVKPDTNSPMPIIKPHLEVVPKS
jgi:hypothetical protein